MAKRAKPLSSSSSGSLFGEEVLAAPVAKEQATTAALGGVIAEAEDARETPKLRVVPPPVEMPEEDVIIEPNGDGRFVVSLLRDHGTTVAAVLYTRKQLEMLLRRIVPALEVG